MKLYTFRTNIFLYIVAALLGAILLMHGAAQLAAQTSDRLDNKLADTTTVFRVRDGDTFIVLDEANFEAPIRIVGIDTYEYADSVRLAKTARRYGISVDSALRRTPVYSRLLEQARLSRISLDEAVRLGRKAHYFLDSLLTNKVVVLTPSVSQDNADRFNRYLRSVQLFPTGEDVADLLRLSGLHVRASRWEHNR